MSTQATGIFKIKSWDEKPYDETAGMAKLTRAMVTESFHGDLQGDASTEYLMSYRPDGSASFVFQRRLVGRIGGKEGSIVLQGSGVYEAGAAHGTYKVAAGSGSGELSGLRGEGGFFSKDEPSGSVTLDYEFE
ncbi:MAG: DUF3224 domain-containing protein [Chloroflexi bacterium]|nr:DUF3224 domain-containing protein [Chloroflexota bacterium]